MAVFGSSSTIQLDTIIFATDFSPASHNAGLYASAVSKRFNTELVVAHGFTLVQAAIEAEVLKSRPSQQRIDLKHDLTLVAEILEAGRGKTEAVLLSGDPNKVISAYAQSRHPSLLVLGTHGGGSIDRFLLGSTAEGILRQTMGAALTIGPRVDILQAGALNIRRILYATDCSAEAAYAAPAAIALAEVFRPNWMCSMSCSPRAPSIPSNSKNSRSISTVPWNPDFHIAQKSCQSRIPSSVRVNQRDRS